MDALQGVTQTLEEYNVTYIPQYEFSLPLPPPENERLIFNKNHRRFILSSKYRQYKEDAQVLLVSIKTRHKIPMMKPTFENQHYVIITPYLPNKHRDPHGILKPLLDVLQGFIFDNDKWLMPIFNPACVDAGNPRVVVRV